MNLSIQSLTLCLTFFIFYHKKVFQKLWKIVFISSNKHFLFLRYSIFFFLFFLQFADSKGQTKKLISVNIFCNSKRQVTSFRPFLFFINLSIKRDWVPFSWSQVTFFMVSFKITYLQKSLKSIACFGLLPKLKRSVGLVLTVDLLLIFSIKIFLIKNPIKWPSFNISRESPTCLRYYN